VKREVGGRKEKEVREEWTDAVNVRPSDLDPFTITMFQIVLASIFNQFI
jgi:hypothetical protein